MRGMIYFLLSLLVCGSVFGLSSSNMDAVFQFQSNGFNNITGTNFTLTGSQTFDSGKYQNGLFQHSVNNQYLTFATKNYGNNYTIAIWIKANSSTPNFAGIFEDGSTAKGIFVGDCSTSYGCFSFRDGCGSDRKYNSTIKDNNWHLIVARQNTTHSILAVDGVNYYNASCTSSFSGTFYIGTDNTLSTTRSFYGALDEVYVWNLSINDSDMLLLNSTFYNFTSAPSNSCSYGGSGDYHVNLSDSCNFTSTFKVNGNVFFESGSSGNYANISTQINASNFYWNNASSGTITYLWNSNAVCKVV